jgi:hypothetical protein
MSKLHHISDADLDRYHFDAIRGPELAMIEEHLLWCLHCVGREEKNLRNNREKKRAHVGHISTDDLELYHLGNMTDAMAIGGIEQHISECPDCADRMMAIDRFVHLVRAGVIRGDSLPSFPVSDSSQQAKPPFENKLRKV